MRFDANGKRIAPPAAERTALKALRAYCVYQRENFEKGIREKPTHPRVRDWSAYAVAYTDVINEIDAQERAASKSIDEEPLAIRYQDAKNPGTNESEIDAQKRAGAKA